MLLAGTMAALSSHLVNGFSPLAKGLAALLVLSGAAITFVPNARLVLGLVSARAFTRPHTLLTCAFAGDLLPVRREAAAKHCWLRCRRMRRCC